MQQSRSERFSRKKQEKARQHQKFVVIFGILFGSLLLLMAIYYIWNGQRGPVSDRVDASEPSAEQLPDGADGANADHPGEEHAAGDDAHETGDNGHAGHVPPPDAQTPDDQAGHAADPDAGVSLALVGDIMMGGRIDGLLRQHGFDYPYAHVGDLLRAADIAAGNLENPITDRGEPADKTYTFRTSPDAVPELRKSGFDLFNLANNHTLDYGLIGMRDTIRYLNEAGLGHMGAGEDQEEAFRPYTIEKNGMRVDFLGFTNVVPDTSWKADRRTPGLAETYNYTRAIQAIERSEAEADLVVVYVHWGIERQETPEPYMVENARRYVDAGADLVVGSHPHVLSGIEAYKDRWIVYSLGNFIFTVNPHSPSRHSAILSAKCGPDGACALRVLPMETGIGQPVPASEESAAAILARISELSVGAEVKDGGEVIRTKAR